MIELNHYYAGVINNETVILQITAINSPNISLNICSAVVYHPTVKQCTPSLQYAFHSNSVMANELIHLGPTTHSIEYYLAKYPELFI